ncbi:DUF536 domain-containing protein (plasmid) [Limosilactobacillus fermentum]|uniref:DUF536 domain-containing protein n=1 Tax=Limosilactobacillus fermentum TaxID=1613 RepID=UPI00331434E3
MEKTYSIKEIAERMHVSKTAIGKLLTPEFREKYVKQSSGQMLLIDQTGADEIFDHYRQARAEGQPQTPPLTEPETGTHGGGDHRQPSTNDHQRSHHDSDEGANHNANQDEPAITSSDLIKAKDEMIEQLKEQLATKDGQIASLQKLIDQEQQLNLAHHQLPAPEAKSDDGTTESAPENAFEGQPAHPEPGKSQSKGFFGRLFGK